MAVKYFFPLRFHWIVLLCTKLDKISASQSCWSQLVKSAQLVFFLNSGRHSHKVYIQRDLHVNIFRFNWIQKQMCVVSSFDRSQKLEKQRLSYMCLVSPHCPVQSWCVLLWTHVCPCSSLQLPLVWVLGSELQLPWQLAQHKLLYIAGKRSSFGVFSLCQMAMYHHLILCLVSNQFV